MLVVVFVTVTVPVYVILQTPLERLKQTETTFLSGEASLLPQLPFTVYTFQP